MPNKMIFPSNTLQGPPQVEAWQPNKTLALTDFTAGNAALFSYRHKKNKGVSMPKLLRERSVNDVL